MRRTIAIPVALSATLLAACSMNPRTGGPAAEAKLQPTQGSTTQGVVRFQQQGDNVLVAASFTGLAPGGHGFHIHETGDCSAPDASSAGGHFNPTGKPHGHPHKGEHHAGDLPMLTADANGNASLNATLTSVTLREGPSNIVGRAVIVHSAPDDFTTQPTGNSGGRLACGVIVAR